MNLIHKASDILRARQEEVRGEFSEALADTPRNTIGRERARWVINSADAGCESPGESLVLLALLRAGINGMTTQEEVHINDHTYFIDIALPHLKIAIEFDGRIKYGETVDQVHDCIEAEQRRQRDLERAGWTVIRVAGRICASLTRSSPKLWSPSAQRRETEQDDELTGV